MLAKASEIGEWQWGNSPDKLTPAAANPNAGKG